ncbi:SigB/SigF/SigG family RNA polymerase sigma factor [Streptomyces sp. NPDC057757]|uniref:SigB/SigF/SigG family RNA polymerase sigma factor n=1 Tax=Streptomyces sp. NPDC057757 TaxID=3346241 RepID=UPI0036BF9F80
MPRIDRPSAVVPRDARPLTKLFLARLQELEEGTPEYQYARNTLIEMNLSLVRFAARRFRNRGHGGMEDIVQVGTIGLIKAIDRFDLTRSVELITFATPYILGEIRRYFRDSTWAVHVPRRLQELRTELAKSRDELEAVLGHDPTVPELAALLNLTEAEVSQGLLAANAYTAGTLDLPVESDTQRKGQPSQSYAETVGMSDPGMERVENLHALAPLLAELPDRDRRIIAMRFGEQLTQARIGELLGCSQMHISRLLARILDQLRTRMLTTT